MTKNIDLPDLAFPFLDDVFLPGEPMTDVQFALFVRPKDTEIPIEEVDFSDHRGSYTY